MTSSWFNIICLLSCNRVVNSQSNSQCVVGGQTHSKALSTGSGGYSVELYTLCTNCQQLRLNIFSIVDQIAEKNGQILTHSCTLYM